MPKSEVEQVVVWIVRTLQAIAALIAIWQGRRGDR